jgi:predicted outer membrane repeat protein
MNTKVIYLFVLFLTSFWHIQLFAQNTIIVTNTNNTGLGSLREAVNDSQKGDTIRFDTDLIKNGNDTIFFETSIKVLHDLTIIGPKNNNFQLVLDGLDKTEIFLTDVASLTISLHYENFTFYNCSSFYGAIMVFPLNCELLGISHLTVKNCNFFSNKTNAIYTGSTGQEYSTLLVENCNFNNNAKTDIYSTTNFVDIDNCTFRNNTSGSVKVFRYSENGQINIQNSKFLNNKREYKGSDVPKGGALEIHGVKTSINNCLFKDNFAGFGGAIMHFGYENSEVTIKNSKFISNESYQWGGAINLRPIESTSLNNSQANLQIINTEFRKNKAHQNGGALAVCVFTGSFSSTKSNLDLRNVIFESNEAKNGGTLYTNYEEINLSLNECYFNKNSSKHDGGAILLGLYNEPGYGNQFYYGKSKNIKMEINKSTFTNNSANNCGGALFTYANNKNDESGIVLKLKNTTISKNKSKRKGGAFYCKSDSSTSEIIIQNSTFYKNNSSLGSHIYNQSGETTYFNTRGSIFSKSENDSTIYNSEPNNKISQGYNVFGDSIIPQAVNTDLLNIDSTQLNLKPLRLNGGRTPTHMPSKLSVAYNNGNKNDSSQTQIGPINQIREIGSTECYNTVLYKDTIVDNCDSVYFFNKWRKNPFSISKNDTLIFYNLIKPTPSYYTMNIVSCSTYTWIDGKQYDVLNNKGVYILTNSKGCDSIITLNLISPFTSNQIEKINNSLVSKARVTFYNETYPALYQWIDCKTKEPILGATQQTFSPKNNTYGEYAVVNYHYVNGCMDTSECITLSTYEFEENENFNVFPNPFSTEFIITTKNVKEPYTYQISNSLGQVIRVGEINSEENKISTESFSRGIYYLTINTEEEKEIFKLVKQ